MAAEVRKGGAKSVPGGKLRGLHLGGGACSLARYFHTAYPDARQVVVELDGKLAEYVRGWFDLPKAPLLRLRVGEAREVTETLTPDSRDFIIRDVFAVRSRRGRSPPPNSMTTSSGSCRRAASI